MQPALKQIRPLLGRVLIQKYVPPKKTTSGVLLPNSKEGLNIGKVIAVGPGKLTDEGKVLTPAVKVGDYVLLPQYGSSAVPKTEGLEDLAIYQSEDIIAIVEGDFNNKV